MTTPDFVIPAIKVSNYQDVVAPEYCLETFEADVLFGEHDALIFNGDEGMNPIYQDAYSFLDFYDIKLLQAGTALGNMVYLATHCSTGTKVVLKMFDTSMMTERIKTLVRREITIHTQLVHPNIIDVYAVFKEGNKLVMVMEFASNGDLYNNMAHWKNETSIRSQVVRPVLNALVYMNALGIIHRDIKPENIFITSNFTIKVGDFGLAIDSNLETPKTPRVGTRWFMAPEICDDVFMKPDQPFLVNYQSKADVYSVCVMIMEMLNHCVPAHVELSCNIINITSKGLIRDPRFRPSIASLMNYPW